MAPDCEPPGARDDCGTLGITGVPVAGWTGAGAGEAGEESVMSSHAAGELSTGFAGSAGHWVRPFGRDGWPGVGLTAVEMASHAAPSPEAGHSFALAGRARLGRWSLGGVDGEGARPGPVVGAASAMTLRFSITVTTTSGRKPVPRRNSKPRQSRRSESSYPSLVHQPIRCLGSLSIRVTGEGTLGAG